MPPRSSVPAILGLFVASLALRPQLLAIGPLLPIIRTDLGLAHGVAGLLGSIPVLCMGLFAPLGPVVAARFGVRWALAGCLGLVGAFGVVRALAPDAAGVLGSTVAIGIQSLVYYGLVSWLPNVYVERGWDEAPAGALVAVMNAVGLVTTIGVPLVADRIGSRRVQLVVASSAAVAGLLGVILVPDLGLAWAAVLGLALGAIFPLVLTLPVDVADSPGDVGATAALMLLGGYVLSSTGPVLLGAV